MSERSPTLDRTVPPAPAPARPFRFPAFERHELEDGLALIVAPRREVPLAFFELLVPSGATLDPPGGAGLAAMTGAMLDEGTAEKSSHEIAAAAERIGGYLSTTTDWDTLSLETGVTSPHAATALGLAGEVLRRPTFPDDELTRLRARCLAEIRRRQAFPSALAVRQFSRALYGSTPYGSPVLGTAASIESIGRDDVESFYRERVAAAPLVLIAAGDLDPGSLGEAVRRELGAPGRRATEAAVPLEPPREPAGTRVFLVDRPDAAQTELRVGHVGVPRKDPDFTALTVMNSLLGGKFTSRLTLNLRERHGITYGIHSGFAPRRGPGPFTISTAVATADTARAVHEIRSELERLREDAVPREELEETRSYILGVFPYTVQSLAGIAHRLREIAVHDLPLDHWDRYPDAVRAISAEEILRVAREHLRPDRLTIVVVGPERELRPQLERFGEPVVWRPAEEPEPV